MPLFQNESKCETFHVKMSSACSFIFMQIKVIFIRMVSHLASHKGTRKWPIVSRNLTIHLCSKFMYICLAWGALSRILSNKRLKDRNAIVNRLISCINHIQRLGRLCAHQQ